MQSSITYKEAVTMLQLNQKNITVPHALINFHSIIIGSKFSGSYLHSDLKEAKNIIIRNWIEEQLQAQGHWELEVPFENKCNRCNGTGEIYKLEKEKFEKKCRYCNGVGYLWLTCKTCHGTGRYVNTNIKGLKIDVSCYCSKFAEQFGQKYKGKIRARCRECRGKGRIANLKNYQDQQHKDFRFTGKIYSTTKCPNCDGYGFPFPLRKPHNPVLSNELAQFISSESAVHEDPIISDVHEDPIIAKDIYVVNKIPIRTVHSIVNPSMRQLARESI